MFRHPTGVGQQVARLPITIVDASLDAACSNVVGMSSSETKDPILWPAGPLYANVVGGEALGAWVRYKVWSADWYVRTLESLGEQFNGFDRYIGIEMALDGAPASLCSAFDAAMGGLIYAAEQALSLPETEEHHYSWKLCKRHLNKLSSDKADLPALVAAINEALTGRDTADPSGWLAATQHLRHRAVHHNTLSRTFQVSTGKAPTPDCALTISGVSVEPVGYLKEKCDRMSDMCEWMLTTTRAIGGDIGAGSAEPRPRWED